MCGHYFLETTRGRAESERHPCVTKYTSMCNEGGEISAVWVEGNLEITLTEGPVWKKIVEP